VTRVWRSAWRPVHALLAWDASSSRWLADPLRPSAEGASPNGVTSDVPCRHIGAWWSAPRSPSRPPPFARRVGCCRCGLGSLVPRGVSAWTSWSGASSVGSMLGCSPSGAKRALCLNARPDPHPCARRESDSLPRLGSGRRAALVIGTVPASSEGLGLPPPPPRTSDDEMLLPDFCNQRAIHAHAKRSIPERGAFAATDRPRTRRALLYEKAHPSHGRRRPLLSRRPCGRH
jgi:hypothetical protein